MKKKLLILLLVCTFVVVALVTTGCKSDELQAQIDTNATKSQTAVDEAAKKAADDLAAAQTALEAAVAKGDKANADALTAAVADLNAAIDAAEAAAAAADGALKTELETAIASAIATLKTELTKNITDAVAALEAADKADADALTAAVAELNAAIDAAEAAATANDEALKTALEAAIAKAVTDAKTELTAKIDAAVAELKVADKTNVDALTAAVETLNTTLAAADAAVKADLLSQIDEKVAAAKTELTAKIDAAVAAAKAELTKNLNDAIKAVNDAAAKDAKALADAIVVLEANKAAAEAADAKLGADLKAAADKAALDLDNAVKTLEGKITALNNDLQAKIDALNTAVDTKAPASELAAAIIDLQGKIDAAKAVADAAATQTAFDELKQAVNDLAMNTGNATENIKNAYISIEKWDATTDAVVAELVTLETNYNKLVTASFYSTLTSDVQNKIFTVYNDAKVRLYRAINAEDVAAISANADAMFVAINYVNDTFYAYNPNYYYKAQQDEMSAAVAKAYAAIVALDAFTGDLEPIKDTLVDELDAVLTKVEVMYNKLTEETVFVENAEGEMIHDILASVTLEWADRLTEIGVAIDAERNLFASWEDLGKFMALYEKAYLARYNDLVNWKAEADAIYAEVEALINSLNTNGFDAIEALKNNGYSADCVATYAELIKAIDDLNAEVGDKNATNTAFVVRAAKTTLEETFAAKKAEYEAYAADLAARLNGYNNNFVFLYNDHYTAVIAIHAEAEAWADAVAARGFALDGTVEAPVVAAQTTFDAGIYAIAVELNDVKNAGALIDADVLELNEDITNMVKILSEYQDRYEQIVADVAAWYADYDAKYATDARVNVQNRADLLDGVAYEALVTLYNAKIQYVIDLAKAAKDAIAAIDINKINLTTEAAILNASNKYTDFAQYLGQADIELFDMDATTVELLSKDLKDKTKAYNEFKDRAIASYNALTILDKDTVDVYSVAEVTALVNWYITNFGVDAKDATSVFPAALAPNGDSYVIKSTVTGETLTFTTDMYNSVKDAYTAYSELRAAKDKEMNDLVADITDLVSNAPSTQYRLEIDNLITRVNEWATGANVDDVKGTFDYTAAQFAGDPADIETAADALNTFNAAVVVLEGRRNDLIVRVNGLTKTYIELADDAVRTAYASDIALLKADIATYIADNGNYGDEFKSPVNDIIVKAELRVEYADVYAAATAVTNGDVQADMYARIAKAFAAAEVAIDAADADAYDLAVANLDLIRYTINAYRNSADDYVSYFFVVATQDKNPMKSANDLDSFKMWVDTEFGITNSNLT